MVTLFVIRHNIREQAKPLKSGVNTPQHFDNICETIQTSDGFSRHLETYYGLIHVIRWLKRLRRVDLFNFFYESGTTTLEKHRIPRFHGEISSLYNIVWRSNPNTRQFLSAASFYPEHRRRRRPQINAITAPRDGSQSQALFTRTL
jgi:hypothetical protein